MHITMNAVFESLSSSTSFNAKVKDNDSAMIKSQTTFARIVSWFTNIAKMRTFEKTFKAVDNVTKAVVKDKYKEATINKINGIRLRGLSFSNHSMFTHMQEMDAKIDKTAAAFIKGDWLFWR